MKRINRRGFLKLAGGFGALGLAGAYPVRFNCPQEIAVLELVPEGKGSLHS